MMKPDKATTTAPREAGTGRKAGTGTHQFRHRRMVAWALMLAAVIAASSATLVPGAEAHGVRLLESNIGQTDDSTTTARNSQALIAEARVF